MTSSTSYVWPKHLYVAEKKTEWKVISAYVTFYYTTKAVRGPLTKIN